MVDFVPHMLDVADRFARDPPGVLRRYAERPNSGFVGKDGGDGRRSLSGLVVSSDFC